MSKTFIMGEGKVLTSAGTWSGLPCIVLCEAKERGALGASAEHERDRVEQDGTIIAFASVEAMENMLKLIVKAAEAYARANNTEDMAAFKEQSGND